MYSQDSQDSQNRVGQTDQPTDDDALLANQDTRPTLDPGGRVIEAPDGAPVDPANNVADLSDGRTVEVPPSNLAAAKELLAAQHAAERRNDGSDQFNQPDQYGQFNSSDQMNPPEYTNQ